MPDQVTGAPSRRNVLMARHGLVEANRQRRYAGASAEPLLEEGRRQSAQLGQLLRGEGVGEVRSSEVYRARSTAAIIAEVLGVTLSTDERLNELGMGPWEGLTEGEVERRYPETWALWNRRPDQVRMPGRETLEALSSRVMAAVDEASRAGSLVLLVTHVAPMRVASLAVLGAPLSRYRCVNVPNAECLRMDCGAGEVWRMGSGTPLSQELQRAATHEAA